LELHGFEIKVSRSDWLHEKRKPDKAETIYNYCDRWYLVVSDKSIVKEGELPPTWGLLAVEDKSLVEVVKAPKIENPKPMDRYFLAALLKRAAEHVVSDVDISDRILQAFNKGLEQGKKSAEFEQSRLKSDYEQLQSQARNIECILGTRLYDQYRGSMHQEELNRVAASFKRYHELIETGGMDRNIKEGRDFVDRLKRLSVRLTTVLDEFAPAIEEVKSGEDDERQDLLPDD
jgi:hypothetical protein